MQTRTKGPEPGAPWTLVGAHGGAGTSTLVMLLNHEVSAPHAAEFTGALPDGQRVAVVAAATASGTQRAAQMVAGWPRDLPRPVLLLRSADPFRTPPLARYQIRSITTEVVAVIRVPYLWGFRQLEASTVLSLSRRATRLSQQLRRRLRTLPETAARGRRP